MGIPILSSAKKDLGHDGVLIHMKDGTIATVKDWREKLRGRHADQVDRIELFPVGGQQIDGKRDDGVIVRGITMELPEVPFQVWMILPYAAAGNIARLLQAPPSAGGQVIWTP